MNQAGAVTVERLDELIQQEADAFFRLRPEWSLTTGPKDIELIAHALRVVLHLGPDAVDAHADDFLVLADIQRPDGGWSNVEDVVEYPKGRVWASAFAALMLIRGNEHLRHARLARAVERAIDYFLATQEGDGRWLDPPTWTDLDATSHPVSFFNVVRAFGKTYRMEAVAQAWEKGLKFVLDRQAEDGGWYVSDFVSLSDVVASGSPIEMTAHLAQDALVADLVLEHRLDVRDACARAVARLVAWQGLDGSWDRGNTDHTMDAVRSLMLVAKVLEDETAQPASAVQPVIERAMAWIVAVKNDVGWGNFPGDRTNVERLCDGLDTLLKYRAYGNEDSAELIGLWGYRPSPALTLRSFREERACRR